ncbi:MAG: hypothetical protein AB7V13_21125 [Pseudorhodoplanes sp.]|uniref:hypothetical protein n=1 Tax=Pseudorhodoplanes sp. TaxID=1934341 RepID=UPI003D0F0302
MTQVVTQIRVDASAAKQGIADYEAAMRRGKAVTEANTGALTSFEQAQRRWARSQTDLHRRVDDLSSSHDRLNQAMRAANDNARQAHASHAAWEVDIVKVANALKTAATAAYIYSPAVRAAVNPVIVTVATAMGAALATIGPAIVVAGAALGRFGVATAAAGGAMSSFAPMAIAAGAGLTSLGTSLSTVSGTAALLARVFAPVLWTMGRLTLLGAAVGGVFSAVNSVVERGSELLEKYANAHRMVDRSDLAASMEGLTKYQQDTISADQVQRAGELGARLEAAKFTIEQFFAVQIDINGAALRLQGIWVGIVELIAQAVNAAPAIGDKIEKRLQSGEHQDFFARLNKRMGWDQVSADDPRFVSPAVPPEAASQVDALAAAYGRLGAAMGAAGIGKPGAPLGGSFAATWGDYIKQLDEVNNKGTRAAETNQKLAASAQKVTTEFARAVRSAERRVDLQEAEAKAFGLGAAAQARFRVEAELTGAALRSELDPATDDVAKKIKEAGDRAEEAAGKLEKLREGERRMNAVRDAVVDFGQTFASAMMAGKSATDALIASLDNLGKSMMNDGIKNAVNAAFRLDGPGVLMGAAQGGVGFGGSLFKKPKPANDNDGDKKEAKDERGQCDRAA